MNVNLNYMRQKMMHPEKMRGDTLSRETWKDLDEAFLDELELFSPILQQAFVNGCSKKLHGDVTVKGVAEAHVQLEHVPVGDVDSLPDDKPKFQLVGTPLPFTHWDFQRELSIRDNARTAGIKVGKALDKTLLYGSDLGRGTSLRGLVGDGTTTVAKGPSSSLVQRIVYAVELLRQKHFYGPYHFVAPKDFVVPDFDIRMDDIESRSESGDVHGEVLILQLQPVSLRIVVGIEPVVVEWPNAPGGFKAYCIIVPQVFPDKDGNVGAARVQI